MAEHQSPQDQPYHQLRLTGPFKGEQGPSKSQVVAVATLLPVGRLLLLLAGITLIGTLIGLAIATPLFVICSPVLIPAALTITLAFAGFLTSGSFGITALSSFSWILNNLRRTRAPEQAKRRPRRQRATWARRLERRARRPRKPLGRKESHGLGLMGRTH